MKNLFVKLSFIFILNISKVTNWILMIAGSLLLIFQLNGYFTTEINTKTLENEHHQE